MCGDNSKKYFVDRMVICLTSRENCISDGTKMRIFVCGDSNIINKPTWWRPSSSYQSSSSRMIISCHRLMIQRWEKIKLTGKSYFIVSQLFSVCRKINIMLINIRMLTDRLVLSFLNSSLFCIRILSHKRVHVAEKKFKKCWNQIQHFWRHDHESPPLHHRRREWVLWWSARRWAGLHETMSVNGQSGQGKYVRYATP